MNYRFRRLPPPPPRCSLLVVPLFAFLFAMLIGLTAFTLASGAESSAGAAASVQFSGSAAALPNATLAQGDRVSRGASWYGEEYRGRPMANGEPFDPDALTCAAWNYPLGTLLEVRHAQKKVVVRVTDRGPAAALVRAGISIDLSRQAFAALGELRLGHLEVDVQSLKP